MKKFHVKSLLLLFSAMHVMGEEPFVLTLLNLDRYPMARCLDGSPGGFYFSRGSGSGLSSFVIQMEGGGMCSDAKDCLGRSLSHLGSSKGWSELGVPCNETKVYAPVCVEDQRGDMFSDNSTINPDLYNFNRVFVNYCDGASYSGGVLQPVEVNDSSIYLRGHYIIEAVMKELIANFNLGKAETVIIKGTSAGGIASYIHADYLSKLVTDVSPSARVISTPDAGLFLDIAAYDGVNYIQPALRYIAAFQNVTPFLNSDCLSHYHPINEEFRCFMSQYVLPFIKVPTFVSNSLVDAWQMTNSIRIGCDPIIVGSCNASQIAYINTFSDAMITVAKPFLQNASNGAFLQSCLEHPVEDVTKYWVDVLVEGVNQLQTFTNWYRNTTVPQGLRVAIDGKWGEGTGSNPTCETKSSTPEIRVVEVASRTRKIETWVDSYITQ